jgi:hypothetical protein
MKIGTITMPKKRWMHVEKIKKQAIRLFFVTIISRSNQGAGTFIEPVTIDESVRVKVKVPITSGETAVRVRVPWTQACATTSVVSP